MKLLGIIIVGFEETDQILIRNFHSSDTGEKMGVQWDSISATHRFQEGSIVQHSHRIWGTHETS
jgi:hypothetical protein